MTLPRTLVSPVFIFACFFISLCVMTAIIYRHNQYFSPYEQPIEITYLTSQELKKIGGDPIPVDVGFFINNFNKFDMNNDEFIVNAILTFEFDPSLISLHSLEQISFERGEILYLSKPTTHLQQERLFARYDVRIKFSGDLNYTKFPFEDHRLPIVLVHKNLSPSNLRFTTSITHFNAPDMNAVGWHQFGRNAVAGYLQAPLGKGTIQYPAVAFTIDYGRHNNMRNIFTIILPMFLLFFIALFSLILDTEENFSFGLEMPIQTIGALIAFRFVIESLSPSVGYFIYSDYFFFIFLGLTFSILLFNTIYNTASISLRKNAIIGFSTLYIVTLFILLSPNLS